MGGLLQLVGLVTLAFAASALLEKRGRELGAAGLYVLLGILIGPLGLALIDEDLHPLLHPLSSLCAMWLSMLFGVRVRAGAVSRLPARSFLAVVLEAGGVVAVTALALLRFGDRFGQRVGFTAALGAGIAGAASSRAAITFARHRLGASGRLAAFLDSVTSADDIVAFIAILALASIVPSSQAPALLASCPLWLAAATLGLGLLMGLIYALAVGREPALERAWVMLLGLSFLGAGTASRLGLPETSVGVVAGFVIAQATGGRLLAEIVGTTERPTTLFLLVIIGARVVPTPGLAAVAGLALALRLLWKVGSGPMLAALGGVRPQIGFGLLGYGGLALAAATQIDLLYGGAAGSLALAVGALNAVAGDILGPLGLAFLFRNRAAAVGAR